MDDDAMVQNEMEVMDCGDGDEPVARENDADGVVALEIDAVSCVMTMLD